MKALPILFGFIFSNFVNAQKIFSIEEKTACFLREVGLFTNVDTPFHVYSLASAINLKEKSQYIFTDTIFFSTESVKEILKKYEFFSSYEWKRPF
jgi:hypothetical protein